MVLGYNVRMDLSSGTTILDRLDPQFQGVCRRLANLAHEEGVPLYLVGGIIRDLLLGYGSIDFDFVIEGDAISFAAKVQRRFGGTLKTHSRFGTANWRPADISALDIDLVTARSESYSKPAALPQTTPADLAADLFRRDFTINTLAIRLDGTHWGTLLDIYGGQSDLAAGTLRILHDQSFMDDPTRIWRGIRFEQRFEFAFDPQTAALMHQGMPHLADVSGDRVRHELQLTLLESHPEPAMRRLDELGVLRMIHPHFSWKEDVAQWWDNLNQRIGTPFLQHVAADWPRWLWRMQLLLLAQAADVAAQTAAKLRLTIKHQDNMRSALALRRGILANPFAGKEPAVSEVDRWLHPFAAPPAALPLVAMTLADPEYAQWITWLEQYFGQWLAIQPVTTGRTLRELGVPPGPRYGEILRDLRAAWLDGKVSTAAEEAVLLKRMI